jgi:D-beta-D-heptose 7-phosphate kinase/D-beta-D-heptose 1-phosphate adenosyltransferase
MTLITDSKASLDQLLKLCRQHQQEIWLVTGVFDLLHQGHLLFLGETKRRVNELKGCLVIGIESDSRVKLLKGEGRPINGQQTRLAQLDETGVADAVFILPEQFNTPADHADLIRLIRPAVLAVSVSTPNLKQKQQIMSLVGGRVEVVCAHDPRYSTTAIISDCAPPADLKE